MPSSRKLPPQIWAMIELQRLHRMRPGEVTAMRTCDIDTSGKVWTYSPPSQQDGVARHQRKIYLGPRAQAVLKPWLRTDLDGYLFQPREAQQWRREQLHKQRKTPLFVRKQNGHQPQGKPAEAAGRCARRMTFEQRFAESFPDLYRLDPTCRFNQDRVHRFVIACGGQAAYQRIKQR